MTDDETPEKNEELKAQEDLVALREKVRIAIEVGIVETEDIQELLETANAEEIRSDARKLVNRIRANWDQALHVHELIVKVTDAPNLLPLRHSALEESLVRRIDSLTAEANPDDMAALAVAYASIRSVSVIFDSSRPADVNDDED